jgi:hypothetical protein
MAVSLILQSSIFNLHSSFFFNSPPSHPLDQLHLARMIRRMAGDSEGQRQPLLI